MIRKLLTLSIATLLTLGLIGCGGEGEEAPEADNPSAATREGATTREPTTPEPQPDPEPEPEPEPESADAQADEEADPAEEPAADDDAEAEVAEVHITGDDAMNYSISRFTVQPGQTVELTLEHIGQMPAAQMGHNVVILVEGENAVTFGSENIQAGAGPQNGYLAEDLRDRVIAATDMVGGGETTSIEFTAPEEPGEYPYLCTFPGHWIMMNGVMEVAAE